MRKTFADFYGQPKDVKEVWADAYFSFDSSFLLELFDLSAKTRDECIKLLSSIPREKRFLTFQAAREYHSGVRGVIQKHKNRKAEVDKITGGVTLPGFSSLSKNESFFSADPDEVFGAHAAILKEPIEQWKKSITATVANLVKQYENDCQVTKKDIADAFDGCVAEPFDDDWLLEKHAIAVVRADSRIPPGYADKESGNKGLNPYGDVLMWFELLEETERRKKPLIFVTKDSKGDWFAKDENKRILHPRPELATEMQRVAKQRFILYEFHDFLTTAPSYLGKGVAISESGLKEIAEAEIVSRARKQRWRELMQESKELEEEVRKLDARIASYENSATLWTESANDAHQFRLKRRASLHKRIDEITEEQLEMFNQEVGFDD